MHSTEPLLYGLKGLMAYTVGNRIWDQFLTEHDKDYLEIEEVYGAVRVEMDKVPVPFHVTIAVQDLCAVEARVLDLLHERVRAREDRPEDYG